MVTRSRKTMLKNPLDEISTKAKPVAKTAPAEKTVRVAKAKSVDVEPKKAAKTKSPPAPQKATKTQSGSAPRKATKAESSPVLRASAKTKTETLKIHSDVSPSASPVRVDSIQVSAKKRGLADAGTQANEAEPIQTAERLMADELAQTADQSKNQKEELVGHPSKLVKPLEQSDPAQLHKNAGGGAIGSQLLSAEDVFQTELTRPRDDVKQEISRTRVAAMKVVKRWARWSVAASFIPTPFIDMAAISGVQVKMIYALCKHYEVDFEQKAAIAIASGVTGGAAVQTIAGVLAKQMVRTMPGIGTVFMFAVEPVISYATTYALGLAFISHFEADGRLHDFNPETIKEYLAAQIDKRKAMFDTKVRPESV